MKKIVCLLMLLLCSVVTFAASGGGTESSYVIELGSFTGIVTVVSAFVTEVCKVVPAVGSTKLAKIGISAGVGVIVCLLAWLLHLTPLLSGYSCWQVILYGLAAGLSGCGFYDVIKAIYNLAKVEKDE